MIYTFYNCYHLTTPPIIPNSVTDMRGAFSKCYHLTTPPIIPDSVTDMRSAFSECLNLSTIHFINTTVDFSKINMKDCFYKCHKLKEFIIDVKYKENKNWILYLLKRNGNNLNIKRYNLSNNTLIDAHTISLGTNATNELTLFTKTDELLIDRNGNITDRQLELLLKNKWEFGDKYTLDPAKKWLVMWADNPDNVRSNCFVTQKELQDLKAKLKTYHPDLF